MGYLQILAPCYVCKIPFFSNPDLVPSITPPGKEHRDREPVCLGCMTRINAKRKEMGLAPHPIREGAYEALEV